MKRFVLTAWIIMFISGTSIGEQPPAAGQPAVADERTTSYWMEKKLDYSQAVLRGLAVGDFESIKVNAAQLHLLNKVEGFIRRRNPDYRHHVQTFERVTNEIVRQAERESLEGVTLAFNQLTISCVNCHQTLRGLGANIEGDQK